MVDPPGGYQGAISVRIESPATNGTKIDLETYRFLNREVFGFLIAMASVKGVFWQK